MKKICYTFIYDANSSERRKFVECITVLGLVAIAAAIFLIPYPQEKTSQEIRDNCLKNHGILF